MQNMNQPSPAHHWKPSALPHKNLAEKFSNYFSTKMGTIQESITVGTEDMIHAEYEPAFTGTPLETFCPATQDEVRKLISGVAGGPGLSLGQLVNLASLTLFPLFYWSL
jgi:hypothetical protein